MLSIIGFCKSSLASTLTTGDVYSETPTAENDEQSSILHADLEIGGSLGCHLGQFDYLDYAPGLETSPDTRSMAKVDTRYLSQNRISPRLNTLQSA